MVKSAAALFVTCMLFFAGCARSNDSDQTAKTDPPSPGEAGSLSGATLISTNDADLEQATFAGGCFWCMDAPFEGIAGVKDIISGFTGGHVKNPTYDQVGTGTTGHYEAIQVVFDPRVISYSELLEIYWKQFDPTDEGGSFHDRGPEYRSAIFYHNDTQKKLAEESKEALDKAGVFGKPIVTRILRFQVFYPAEAYHQHYCKTHPDDYHRYREASGRDDYIQKIWGKLSWSGFKKPSQEELKKTLTAIQYKVTQEGGTERPFTNPYAENTRKGIYVDVVSGEPLFSSTNKFDSGTGWPSFTEPIDPRFVVKRIKQPIAEEGAEVRSRYADSHLGDVFDDGPAPNHLRFCMDSAALRFIPLEEMQKEGYGNFLYLFKAGQGS